MLLVDVAGMSTEESASVARAGITTILSFLLMSPVPPTLVARTGQYVAAAAGVIYSCRRVFISSCPPRWLAPQ